MLLNIVSLSHFKSFNTGTKNLCIRDREYRGLDVSGIICLTAISSNLSLYLR